VDGSQGPPQRAICSPCFAIWYDMGICDPTEIGQKNAELRKAGKYPFEKDGTYKADELFG